MWGAACAFLKALGLGDEAKRLSALSVRRKSAAHPDAAFLAQFRDALAVDTGMLQEVAACFFAEQLMDRQLGSETHAGTCGDEVSMPPPVVSAGGGPHGAGGPEGA